MESSVIKNSIMSEVDIAIKDIDSTFNINVIIDTRDLIPEHIKQLKETIKEAGIGDRIIWCP